MFSKKEAGKFSVVRAEPVTEQMSPAYSVSFSGTKLSNKDGLFGKSGMPIISIIIIIIIIIMMRSEVRLGMGC
jgi:hypothetical protein